MTALTRASDHLVVPDGVAAQRTIAVHRALAAMLPEGLVRGSSVVCAGPAAASTAFLLAAAHSQDGAWVGVGGLPTFGAQACREMGVALERVVLVVEPPTRLDDSAWAAVLGALVDGFDIVLFGAARRVRPATARRVQARLQRRGAVLVLVGEPGPFSTDVRVTTTTAIWHGLGEGSGHLRHRTVAITVDGRRVHRPRHGQVAMPGPSGGVEPAASTLRQTG